MTMFTPQLSQPSGAAQPLPSGNQSLLAMAEAIDNASKTMTGVALQWQEGRVINASMEEAERIGNAAIDQMGTEQVNAEGNGTYSEAIKVAERMKNARLTGVSPDRVNAMARAKMAELITRAPMFADKISAAFDSALGRDSAYQAAVQAHAASAKSQQEAGIEQFKAIQEDLDKVYGVPKSLYYKDRDAYLKIADIISGNAASYQTAQQSRQVLEDSGVPPSPVIAQSLVVAEAAMDFQNINAALSQFAGLPNPVSEPDAFFAAISALGGKDRANLKVRFQQYKGLLEAKYRNDRYYSTLPEDKLKNALAPILSQVDAMITAVDAKDVAEQTKTLQQMHMDNETYKLFQTNPAAFTLIKEFGQVLGTGVFPEATFQAREALTDTTKAWLQAGGSNPNGASLITILSGTDNTASDPGGALIKTINATVAGGVNAPSAEVGDAWVNTARSAATGAASMPPAKLREIYSLTAGEGFQQIAEAYPEATVEQVKALYMQGLQTYAGMAVPNFAKALDDAGGIWTPVLRDGQVSIERNPNAPAENFFTPNNGQSSAKKIEREAVSHINTIIASVANLTGKSKDEAFAMVMNQVDPRILNRFDKPGESVRGGSVAPISGPASVAASRSTGPRVELDPNVETGLDKAVKSVVDPKVLALFDEEKETAPKYVSDGGRTYVDLSVQGNIDRVEPMDVVKDDDGNFYRYLGGDKGMQSSYEELE